MELWLRVESISQRLKQRSRKRLLLRHLLKLFKKFQSPRRILKPILKQFQLLRLRTKKMIRVTTVKVQAPKTTQKKRASQVPYLYME